MNAARAKKILGDYAGAVESLGRAIASEERWADEHRASLYLELGKCCDLAVQRVTALLAYENVLTVRSAQSEDSSNVSRAKRYAGEPYSEREWLEEMKSWER